MKTNANTRIRLEARFRLCGAFLQNFAWLDRLSSQRHIRFIATEEVKLDGYRALAVKSDTGAAPLLLGPHCRRPGFVAWLFALHAS
jgi:hypothetical protein